MYRVNVLENVINRQSKKNRRRTVSTFKEKCDKPELKKILLYFKGRIFCLTMMYLLKKFRKSQTGFSRKSRKISLQSKKIQREERVCVVLMRQEKAFSEGKEEFLQVAPSCAALKSLIFLVVLSFI